MVLDACSSESDRGAVRASTTRSRVTAESTTSSTTAAVTPPSGTSSSQLAAAVPDVAPKGFAPGIDETGLVGVIDLQDVSDAVGPDAAAALERAGFIDGYGRSWSRGSGADLEIRNIAVLAFADPAGARTAATAPLFGPNVAVPALDADGTARLSFVRNYDGTNLRVEARLAVEGARLALVWVSARADRDPGGSADRLFAATRAATGP